MSLSSHLRHRRLFSRGRTMVPSNLSFLSISFPFFPPLTPHSAGFSASSKSFSKSCAGNVSVVFLKYPTPFLLQAPPTCRLLVFRMNRFSTSYLRFASFSRGTRFVESPPLLLISRDFRGVLFPLTNQEFRLGSPFVPVPCPCSCAPGLPGHETPPFVFSLYGVFLCDLSSYLSSLFPP